MNPKKNPYTLRKTIDRELKIDEILERLNEEHDLDISYTQLFDRLIESALADITIVLRLNPMSDLQKLNDELLKQTLQEQKETNSGIKELNDRLNRLEKLITKQEDDSFLLEEEN